VRVLLQSLVYTIHLFLCLRARDYIYVSTVYRCAVRGSAVAGFMLCVFSVCVVVRSAVFRAERGFVWDALVLFVLWNLLVR